MADEDIVEGTTPEETEQPDVSTLMAEIKELKDERSREGERIKGLNDHIQQIEGRFAERDSQVETPTVYPAGMSEDEWEDLTPAMQKVAQNMEARFTEVLDTQVANLKTQDMRNNLQYKEEGPIAQKLMDEWDKEKKFPYVTGEARLLMAFDMAKEQKAAQAAEEEEAPTFPGQAIQRGGYAPSTNAISKKTDPKLWEMALALKGNEKDADEYFQAMVTARKEGRA